MITLFTTAKPFEGKWSLLQRNAIRSWQRLARDVEIILFGNGGGYAEAARELGVIHVPDVASNEKGMPRVDAMFREAERRGRHPLRAYVNCDVILLEDFADAVTRIPFDRFLMVARRWDLDVKEELDFEEVKWPQRLREAVRSAGELQYPGAIDVFAWHGQVWDALPPMVVGRGMYDQWLIYDCRKRRVPVVDATDVVTLVHQAHDYSHIHGGKMTVALGEEAQRNLEYGGGYENMFTIQDADWRLTGTTLIRNWYRGDSERCGDVFQLLRGSRSGCPWVPRWFVELVCEAVTRWRKGRSGDWKPLLKLPLWLIRRLAGRGRKKRRVESGAEKKTRS
jgi:hypothetical protein